MKCSSLYRFLSSLIASLPPEERSILDFSQAALNGTVHVVYPMRATPVDDLLTVTGGGRICRRWPQCAHHILRPEAATSNVDAPILECSNVNARTKVAFAQSKDSRTGFRFQED